MAFASSLSLVLSQRQYLAITISWCFTIRFLYSIKRKIYQKNMAYMIGIAISIYLLLCYGFFPRLDSCSYNFFLRKCSERRSTSSLKLSKDYTATFLPVVMNLLTFDVCFDDDARYCHFFLFPLLPSKVEVQRVYAYTFRRENSTHTNIRNQRNQCTKKQ